jgi:hypothetical protein
VTDAAEIGAGPTEEPNATESQMVAPGGMPSRRLLGPPARVQCANCEFLWYGATAAHGLSIIGHCPRCGGSLQFRDEPSGASIVAAAPVALDLEPAQVDLEPAQVLGTPQTWGR